MTVTETFQVRDGDGREYLVMRVQPEIDTSTLQARASTGGLPYYRLADASSLLERHQRGHV